MLVIPCVAMAEAAQPASIPSAAPMISSSSAVSAWNASHSSCRAHQKGGNLAVSDGSVRLAGACCESHHANGGLWLNATVRFLCAAASVDTRKTPTVPPSECQRKPHCDDVTYSGGTLRLRRG